MHLPSSESPSCVWRVIRWTLAVPGMILLVITIGIAARYLAGKSRLDRLCPDLENRIYIEFEPVAPIWVRNWIGDAWCEPLDRIKAITFGGATDDDLTRWRGCYDAPSVKIGNGVEVGNGYSDITDRGLARLSEL